MSQPKRILIVDDEAHIVQVLMLKLRNAGFGVMSASDGEEGLEVALKERPDLIITDFQMPYMTGLELCRALAEHETTCAIPVVMLTARGYAMDAEDLAISSGSSQRGGQPLIREVLTKPFSPRAIVDQIQRILNGEAGLVHGVESTTADAVAAEPSLGYTGRMPVPPTEVV